MTGYLIPFEPFVSRAFHLRVECRSTDKLSCVFLPRRSTGYSILFTASGGVCVCVRFFLPPFKERGGGKQTWQQRMWFEGNTMVGGAQQLLSYFESWMLNVFPHIKLALT